MAKHKKKIRIACITIVFIGMSFLFLYSIYFVGRFGHGLDFSQQYRYIPGIEKVKFSKNGWNDKYYQRSFWGMKKSSASIQSDAIRQEETIIGIDKLQDIVKEGNEIRQSVLSPDKKYLLYCEIEYVYWDSGMTDDEYCYYKVYELESKKVTTIYEAYRKWYNLYWE